MALNGRQCFGGEIGLLRVSRFVLVFEMGFEWVCEWQKVGALEWDYCWDNFLGNWR